jgi:hypothetical protein
MTDTVDRLLAGAGGGKHWMELHTDAANEIKRLREIERLYDEALNQAPVDVFYLCPGCAHYYQAGEVSACDCMAGLPLIEAHLYAAPVPRAAEDCSVAVPKQKS